MINRLKQRTKSQIQRELTNIKLTWRIFNSALQKEFVRNTPKTKYYGIYNEYKMERKLWNAFFNLNYDGKYQKPFLYLQYAVTLEQRITITDGRFKLTPDEIRARRYAIQKTRYLLKKNLLQYKPQLIQDKWRQYDQIVKEERAIGATSSAYGSQAWIKNS